MPVLWQRVTAGEMPPDRPLSPAEQDLLQGWIAAGMPGLAAAAQAGGGHWAFAPLRRPQTPPAPPVTDSIPATTADGRPPAGVRTAIDAHLQAALAARQLTLSPDADRPTPIGRQVGRSRPANRH